MTRPAVLHILLSSGLLLVLASARSVTRVVDNDGLEVEEDPQDYPEQVVPFNLEETYGQNFLPYNFNGTWKSDTEIVYSDADTGDIMKFDASTQRKTVLFDVSVLRNYKRTSYVVSPDESYLLIGHDSSPGFRHSAFKKYVVYDAARMTYKEIANGTHSPLAQWLPNKNALIYVLENDIYYQSFAGETGEIRRLTSTGVPGIIYNGVPDWVYEEEVMQSASAVWFSADGSHLAFASFNDSEVKDASYFYYGDPGSLEYQYPTEVRIKYPKAGTKNPTVSLSVVDLNDPRSIPIDLPAPIDAVGRDHILHTVSWFGDRIAATWTNRVQNRSETVMYDRRGVASRILTTEEPRGWLRIAPPFHHDRYLVLLTSQDSGTPAGSFQHVTRFELAGGVLANATDLTPGPFEVQSLLGVGPADGRVYYLANQPDEPSHRNLYSVPLRGGHAPTCISCDILTPEGNNCTYASAFFSKYKSYYALSCLGPDPATVTVHDAYHRPLQLWEANRSLRRRLASRARPVVKDLYVSANGHESKVRLVLPPDFDEDETYPMLVNVYAGPNTVRITDAASYGFHSYMATNRSVIYAWIDGRGSANRGSNLLYTIYRNLGTVEIEDQITVVGILQNTYPWIDASNTAVWGWSYGGFATAMILATDKASVFKCGISVAPVTSWIYYDSIYTERYMGLPTESDNLAGYNRTDATSRAEGLRGKRFMLVHGTGDDNVHYQQAMALAKALELADVPFEQVTYTDEAHGLTGVSPHLYHTMDKFWGDCLGLSHAR